MDSFYQETELMQFMEFVALWKAVIYKHNIKGLISSFEGNEKHFRLRNNLPMRLILLEAPQGSGLSVFIDNISEHFSLQSYAYDQLSNLDMREELNNFVNYQPGLLKRPKPDVFFVEDGSLLDESRIRQLSASARQLFKAQKNEQTARPCFIVVTTSDVYSSELWELREQYPMIRLKLDSRKIMSFLPNYEPSNTIAAQLNERNFFGDDLNAAKELMSPVAAIAAGALTRRAEYLLQNYDFERFEAVECVKGLSDQEYGTAQLFFEVFRRVSGDHFLLRKASERVEKAVFELPFVLNEGRGFRQAGDLAEFEREFLATGTAGDETLGILAELFGSRSAYPEDISMFALHAALQKTSFCKAQTALRLLKSCQIPDFAAFEIAQARRQAISSAEARLERSLVASSPNLTAFDAENEMFELIAGMQLENFVGALSADDQEALATAAVAAAELGYCEELSGNNSGTISLVDAFEGVLTENAKRQLCAAVEAVGTAWDSTAGAVDAILAHYREEAPQVQNQRYIYHEGVTLAVRVSCKFKDLF